jgi:hypothetical protein
MLQIAIFGIAIMLVLKGLDVWHQQKIAESAGHVGSHVTAMLACAVAVFGAVFLIWLSFEQVNNSPTLSSAAGTQGSSMDLQAVEEAADAAEKAAEVAEKAAEAAAEGL